MSRYGGDWQPLLRDFADAVAALELPDTAWAVLSCPVDGVALEQDFIALIDRDGDGRVRTDDVREAVAWTASMLGEWGGVSAGASVLRIADLSGGGAAHHTTALALRNTLLAGAEVGAEKGTLTLADLRNTEALCQGGDRDGDGVVPVHCLPLELQSGATDILSICTPEADRHGNPGITQGVLDAFVIARDTYGAWECERGLHYIWGETSAESANVLLACDNAVRAWFALCEIHSFAPEQADLIERLVVPIDTLPGAGRDYEHLQALLDGVPIAAPHADGVLGFDQIRPSRHQASIVSLRDAVFGGAVSIDKHQWEAAVVAARQLVQWLDAGEPLSARAFGEKRIAQLDDATLAQMRECCLLDEVNQRHFHHLQDLEKLLIFQRDLFTFCRNFIAFTDLMDPTQRAIFERGSLIMGGREFHFSMRVRNIGEHKKRAEESGIFVLYVEVAFRWHLDDAPIVETVAVPVTRGTRTGLRVHRRGVFIDRTGRYHEAVVVDLVENPVSLTEAFLAPFRRVGQYISSKLETLTEKLDADFDKQVTDVSKAPAPAPAVGMNPIMGGTVAFAALGSAFAFITKQLSDIGGPRIFLALVVVSLLVAIPSVLMASVRLYKRNLAGLISASDWALNDQMRLTVSLGRLFTRRPALPAKVNAQTRDHALEQLKRVDPRAVTRARALMGVRALTVLTMTALLLAVVVPVGQMVWVDQVTWVAGAIHLTLLLWVGIAFARTRRFRRVYWWPVLTAFPAGVLVGVFYLTQYG
jgi:hypothetical protein